MGLMMIIGLVGFMVVLLMINAKSGQSRNRRRRYGSAGGGDWSDSEGWSDSGGDSSGDCGDSGDSGGGDCSGGGD